MDGQIFVHISVFTEYFLYVRHYPKSQDICKQDLIPAHKEFTVWLGRWINKEIFSIIVCLSLGSLVTRYRNQLKLAWIKRDLFIVRMWRNYMEPNSRKYSLTRLEGQLLSPSLFSITSSPHGFKSLYVLYFSFSENDFPAQSSPYSFRLAAQISASELESIQLYNFDFLHLIDSISGSQTPDFQERGSHWFSLRKMPALVPIVSWRL